MAQATKATLPEDRLWSVDDAAAYLGVTKHALYGWRNAGTGPPARRVGRQLRYLPEDVREWFKSLPTEVWIQ